MLKPGTVVGGWTVESLLDGGQTTALYRIRRDQEQAVLRLLLMRDPSFGERLLRNAALTYTLRHANLVPVLGIVEHEGQMGVLSAYYEGAKNILDWTRSEPRSTRAVLDAFDGMLRGIEALHREGIVHRNLKPTKVLMVPGSSGLSPRVDDFLLSKARDPNEASDSPVTTLGVTFGTAAYMPPEQFTGASHVDERSDLYAAGCVLYELLTGRPPHQGGDLFELMKAAVSGELEPASAHRRNVPPALNELLRDLLRPRPEDRVPDVGTALTRLDAIRAELRTWTRPPPQEELEPARPEAPPDAWDGDIVGERTLPSPPVLVTLGALAIAITAAALVYCS